MVAVILTIVLLLIGFVVVYNKLIALIEAVRNNNKQIDIQLDRRYKVFESLINVVKKSMDYERSTLKEVVALRNQALQADQTGDQAKKMAAENAISQIAGQIHLVFEQYPELKANQNALQLQEEVVSTENKLAYAKQAYNDSVEQYNANKKSLFQSVVVGLLRKRLDYDFPYWQLSAEQIQQKEDYRVDLNTPVE